MLHSNCAIIQGLLKIINNRHCAVSESQSFRGVHGSLIETHKTVADKFNLLLDEWNVALEVLSSRSHYSAGFNVSFWKYFMPVIIWILS